MSLPMDFSDWLISEMNKNGWSQADLARAAGLNRQVISTYINRRREKPDVEALVAIAFAFKYSPEVVLRAAGLIPPLKEADPLTKEAEFILSHLSQKRRQQAIEYIKYLAQLQDQEEEELSNVVRKQGMGKTQLQKP